MIERIADGGALCVAVRLVYTDGARPTARLIRGSVFDGSDGATAAGRGWLQGRGWSQGRQRVSFAAGRVRRRGVVAFGYVMWYHSRCFRITEVTTRPEIEKRGKSKTDLPACYGLCVRA